MLSNPLTTNSGNNWPIARKIIFIICLFSFVFQLYRITAHYYRYETEFKTNLSNGNKEVLDFPAISLCVEEDAIFLKSSLRKKFPEINKYLKEIDQSNHTEKESLKDEVYYSYLRGDRNFNKYFDSSIQASDLAMCTLYPWLDKKSKFKYCSTLSPILESLVNLNRKYQRAKCFTFLSRQQLQTTNTEDLQVNIKVLEDFSYYMFNLLVFMGELNETLKNGHFGSFPKKSVFLFIHDSNGLPSFETLDAIELKAGNGYEIRFWSTTKSLLKKPYHSNCFDYHKNPKGLSKSKDQCIHDCYLAKMMHARNCLMLDDLILNNDKLKSYNPGFCQGNNPIKDIYYSRGYAKFCRKTCQQDCHRTEYKFDYKETKFERDFVNKVLEIENVSIVNFKYKKESNSEFRELPVQSMCATIQKMFLSLLIWFGLSIFSFSSFFEMAVNKAKPHMYYIHTFDDKVSPSVVSVTPSNRVQHNVGWNGSEGVTIQTEQPMIKPKFTTTKIGSNVKLEHYNDFISKVVDGYPTAHTVELPQKKSFTQY